MNEDKDLKNYIYTVYRPVIYLYEYVRPDEDKNVIRNKFFGGNIEYEKQKQGNYCTNTPFCFI